LNGDTLKPEGGIHINEKKMMGLSLKDKNARHYGLTARRGIPDAEKNLQ
jgi:hypothetical protein